jgi:hypothetical protein
VLFAGRGHPAIRATHDKTLEITPEPDISARATCVVAVGDTRTAEPMAGDVRITVRAAGESFAFEARANSSWEPGGSAVIRRSAARLPGTFATHASAGARALPRALAARLRDPDTRVEVEVEPVRGRDCVVLFALDPTLPHDARLTAERTAADVVVAEDEDAARVLGRGVERGTVPVAGRMLVVAARDLPGRSVVPALREAEVETVGLPPALAAAAASPSRGPLFVAASDADPRQVLRDASALARVVLDVPSDRLPVVARLAAQLRGAAEAVVAVPFTAPVRWAFDAPPPAAQGVVAVCLPPATGPEDVADVRVRTAVDALLADGVPTKVVAAALAALTGWDRRRAYAAVLRWPRLPVNGG